MNDFFKMCFKFGFGFLGKKFREDFSLQVILTSHTQVTTNGYYQVFLVRCALKICWERLFSRPFHPKVKLLSTYRLGSTCGGLKERHLLVSAEEFHAEF